MGGRKLILFLLASVYLPARFNFFSFIFLFIFLFCFVFFLPQRSGGSGPFSFINWSAFYYWAAIRKIKKRITAPTPKIIKQTSGQNNAGRKEK